MFKQDMVDLLLDGILFGRKEYTDLAGKKFKPKFLMSVIVAYQLNIMINGKQYLVINQPCRIRNRNYNCNDFHEVLVQLRILDGNLKNLTKLPPAYLLGSSYEMFKQHFQRVDKNVIELINTKAW